MPNFTSPENGLALRSRLYPPGAKYPTTSITTWVEQPAAVSCGLIFILPSREIRTTALLARVASGPKLTAAAPVGGPAE